MKPWILVASAIHLLERLRQTSSATCHAAFLCSGCELGGGDRLPRLGAERLSQRTRLGYRLLNPLLRHARAYFLPLSGGRPRFLSSAWSRLEPSLMPALRSAALSLRSVYFAIRRPPLSHHAA